MAIRAESACQDPTSGEKAPARQQPSPEKQHALQEARQLAEEAEKLWRAGKFDDAIPLAEQALIIRQRELGDSHAQVASSLNNLGILHRSKGNISKAEFYYRQALAMQEKLVGEKHPATTSLLNNLGNLYLDRGDYAQAEQYHERALRLREETQGAEHAGTIQSLTNLAATYRAQGRIDKAEPLLLRVIAIREKTPDPKSPDLLNALQNLANLYLDKRDYAQAETLINRVLRLREQSNGTNHPYYAQSLNILADVYRAREEFALAEPIYQRAMNIRENVLGAQHPDVARSVSYLALVNAATGRVDRAIEYQMRSQTINERNLSLHLVIGSERQKLAWLDRVHEKADDPISLHLQLAPDNAEAIHLALTSILQRKGRVMDAMVDTIAMIDRRADPAERKLIAEWKDTTTRLANLVLNGPQQGTAAEHQAKIQALEFARERLEAGISDRNAGFHLRMRSVSPTELQAAIPAEAILLEFIVYRPLDFKTGMYKEPRYAVYLITREGPLQARDLGEVSSIDSVIAAFRQALRDPRRGDVGRLAQALDEKLMDPIRPALQHTRRLLLSPDGALNLLPFGALQDARQQYLISRFSLSYLTSGRDLVSRRQDAQTSEESLVLADPVYGANPRASNSPAGNRDIVKKDASAATSPAVLMQSLSLDQAFFPPLPGTAGEARALKTYLAKARILSGELATETSLKQAQHPRILHIATHGFFLRNAESPLGQSRGANPLSDEIENPLLRSGLALAGANQRRSGNEDGILTALEAAALDLRGTRLVVLSACDTGIGEVKNGEGVYGLRRAFAIAGAESQVMSLWPVSDLATRDLMVDYYRRLQRGEGRGEALRQVQLQMLRNPKRQHPYYWASFIQSGEWANLDGKR